ncbi:hypothetical protein N5D52_10130 [Pseudomonas sp. GD03860]|uniref:hypothetical protein n=1 Tax=Pseudomonas TaxID=286 RepID=UPI0023645669|nr:MULTISPECIES: hypothetical protein [Pseudomonas]MDD2056331.1 hypothetical protein [Pseudomonas putida]MDH0637300.1 hypothetical protein [Pseudomonas sp. GD03860]
MQTQSLIVVYDGRNYVGYDYMALPLGAALAVATQQIEQCADQSRSAVLGDPLRAVEYRLTADEAERFAAADYAGPVPPTVQAWMDAAGLEAQTATDDILTEARAWKAAIYAIRAERLKGKQAVLKATSHAEAERLADAAITAIRTCIVGVGNAA